MLVPVSSRKYSIARCEVPPAPVLRVIERAGLGLGERDQLLGFARRHARIHDQRVGGGADDRHLREIAHGVVRQLRIQRLVDRNRVVRHQQRVAVRRRSWRRDRCRACCPRPARLSTTAGSANALGQALRRQNALRCRCRRRGERHHQPHRFGRIGSVCGGGRTAVAPTAQTATADQFRFIFCS